MRVIAVLAVVLCHAFPTLLPGGFTGVDIFFSISGYLICSILLKGMAAQQFSLPISTRAACAASFPRLRWSWPAAPQSAGLRYSLTNTSSWGLDQPQAVGQQGAGVVLKDFPQVGLLDSAAPLCDAARCRVIIDGKLMYRDTHHLSYDGELYVGEYFSPHLQSHR